MRRTGRAAAHSPKEGLPPLRICFLADAPSVLNQRWFAHAVDRGDEVHVITLDPSSEPVSGVIEHVVGAGLPARVPRSARMLLALPEARRLVRQLRPDIVHSHYAWGFGIWGAASGVHPLVVSAWGTDVMGTGQRSPVHAGVLRWVFSRADAVCATGDRLAAAAGRFTDQDVIVTPFGVDTELFRPGHAAVDDSAGDRPLRIGMVKRLDDNSGIEILLRALADRAAPSDATLQVIGAAVDDRWQRVVDELGLTDRITFLGTVPPHGVAETLRTWDVAVQPSRWVEGFGVSALEASASGVPVIASRLGGLQEVVIDGHTGVLVPPNDPHALALAIAELAADPDRRRRMGAAGREWVIGRYDERTVRAAMDHVHATVLKADA